MAQSNRDYWRKREEEARRHEIKDEEEYRKRLAEIYRYTQSNIEKEINGFYARYAAKNGITMAEARKRASKADMEGLARKAAKYVAEKDFSDQANEEMSLYNLTMKANRLELLKANIGLELVDGFNDVEKEIRADLTETALKEYARMAGILGASVRGSEKHARVLVNASFRNATFSERVWASQTVLKSNLERLLTIGIIQGRNPNVLMTEVMKAMKVSEYEARRLLVTEMCRLQTEVQKESYERNGYEQYIIITCGEDACEECQKMDGRVFFVKDMAPGDNAPPFHPSCRCSTAEYADKGRLEELIGQIEKEREEENETNEENHDSMSRRVDIGSWPPPGEKISEKELRELFDYGAKNKIDVKSFENYDGDIELIKNFIDGIVEVAGDYPEILNGKRKLQIRCSYQMAAADYAETTTNCIVINGNAYRNREALRLDYEKQQEGEDPFFVKGTTYENISHHESGHLIVQVFGLSPKKIIGNADQSLISDYARKSNKEAIAESFSAHYAGVKNETASHVKQNCDIMIAERRRQK